MLSGLAFTDERDDRKRSKKESKKKKSHGSKKRHKRSHEDDRRLRSEDASSASESDESRGKSRGVLAPEEHMNDPASTTEVREESKHEENDFFSAALASKASAKGEGTRGADLKRKEEEERVAKIVSQRELNPEMRGDGDSQGAALRAGVSSPASVVGDGGASWRLKALRRAQERAAAEGRKVDEVVSEHWGSINELVTSIGDSAAHSKAHLHARHDRAGGKPRGRDYDRNRYGDDARPRMRVPESFGQRGERQVERRGGNLRAEDRELISSAMATSNKFASDGSFMEAYEKQQSSSEEKPKNPMMSDIQQPVRRPSPVRELPPARVMPESRNVTQATSTNMSAAAALKARLMGNKAPQSHEVDVPAKSMEVLPMVTADGRAAPGAFGRETTIKGGVHVAEGSVRKAPKTTQRFNEGERTRYFADDDEKTLRDLVAEQKYGGVEDYDRNLADNIARHKKYRGKELDVDDEYDHDGGLEMYENREKKMSGAKQQMKAKEKAVRDYKRMQTSQNKCIYCIDAPDKPKHLHVAYGNLAYLMLPAQGRLVPGHCIIAPIAHAQSSRQVDEDVWEEMRNFKKCLVRMFSQEGKECCFIETAMNLGHAGRHAVVECIPVPADIAARAPMYFKKAIDEAESEWSTHDAKKCLSTAPPKGLRGTIPSNFPYFHVEFNMRGGFVHVIDDETKWKWNFGRNILIGLLDLPENLTDAKQRPLAPSVLHQEMDAFLDLYDPVDWTKQLQ